MKPKSRRVVRSIRGIPILDAKAPIRIRVREEDISGASPKEPDCCAFARACQRQMHVAEVRVHLGRVYVRTSKGNWRRYITPRSLRTEIIAFDRGGEFMDGVYTLGAPKHTKATTGKRKGSRTNESVSRKKRHPPHVVKNVRIGPAYYNS